MTPFGGPERASHQNGAWCLPAVARTDEEWGIPNKPGFSGCRRLRGGAGRTRTNHQSVMEHGWCPTNSPGRTPIQIAGRFAVLLDFPGFLILEPTTKVLWNMAGVRPTTLVGHPFRSSGICCFPFSVIILAAVQTRTSNQI